MEQEAYRYVKGHCGWDSVTLVYGEEIAAGDEHRVAHTLLQPPCHGGIEIGFMYPPEGDEHIRLRIIDSTTKTWLPMCGGMSQVIGFATFKTSIHEKFNIKKQLPTTRINVLTDSGLVPIEIDFEGEQITKIITLMPEYPKFLYTEGVQEVSIRGISAMKVGYFLIFKMDDLKKKYPNIEFGHRFSGRHLDLLGDIQYEYLQKQGLGSETLYSMIYDFHPENDGDARIFTRFFRGKGVPPPTHLEGQCGTGTIAVGIAMAEKGELPIKGNNGQLFFEWGSRRLTQDPYGNRKSILYVELKNRRIASAAFSHNIVELQSVGTAYLPSFQHNLF